MSKTGAEDGSEEYSEKCANGGNDLFCHADRGRYKQQIGQFCSKIHLSCFRQNAGDWRFDARKAGTP